MDLGIGGKVAMVAAGSKGIGLAIAKALAAEGAHVAIAARTPETLAAAAAEIGPATHVATVDVSKAEDLERWVDAVRKDLGAPQIVVTNTGGPPAGTLDAMTDTQWQGGFDSTLMNVVRLVRLVEPDLKASGWGRIVHLTSLVASEPNRLLPISSTLRAGLVALTKLQARELAPYGVTVNGVLPGHTLTDRQRHLAQVRAEREGISPEEALARTAASVPLGRLGDPSEIAAAVAFLCGAPAAYITGVSLLVDGGLTQGI